MTSDKHSNFLSFRSKDGESNLKNKGRVVISNYVKLSETMHQDLSVITSMRLMSIPHVMFILVLTPGDLSEVMMSGVETLSTSVAVNPPCMVPPRLRRDWASTVTSQVYFPGIADTTSSCAVRDSVFNTGLGILDHIHSANRKGVYPVAI